MTATISRLYNTYADAREAVRNLEAAGVAHGDINIIASNADDWYSPDRKTTETFPDRDLDGKDDRAEAAGAGAGVGAAVGGTAGLLAGLGMMAIPGVGPVVAAGWLASTLLGAAAGGVAGSWGPSPRLGAASKRPMSMPKDCAAEAPWSARAFQTGMLSGCRR